jgi:predicted nucleic acid-binding protein
LIVVDTSVAIKWVIPEPNHERALELLGMNEAFVAPDILLAEMANVLRRKQRRGELTDEQVVDGIAVARTSISKFVPMSNVIGDVPSLMNELDHSAYDCCFLATAIGRGLLVTADSAFARKCSDRGYGRFVSTLDNFDKVLTDARLGAAQISKPLLANIERLSIKIQATFAALNSPIDDQRFQFVDVTAYRPAFDSPAYRSLENELEKLEPAELSLVLALGWYGRPEHRIEEWPNLHGQAVQFDPTMKVQRGYIMAQMPNVKNGFEKLQLWLQKAEAIAKSDEN